MADFSLTTLFVVPTTQTTLPDGSSTQALSAGEVGIFDNDYVATDTPGDAPYFYIAQGRLNNYLQGSKRSDKIAGCSTEKPCRSNVTEWYKVTGCGTPRNEIIDINGWSVKCGDIVTLTIRAHSSYIDTLYFNGLTRSATVQAPCCDCDDNPCDNVDVNTMIDAFIAKFEEHAPGINPDNLILTDFFTFTRVGTGVNAILRIEGNPLTKYGQPCDVAAFPFEYDRLWFRTFVYSGPATTADFIVSDACNIVAVSTITQTSTYATGTSNEIKQLEKNYYSYQAGFLKHLFRMAGYNTNFESWVTDGIVYDTFYIKFNELNKSAYAWGDYVPEDAMVILAVPTLTQLSIDIEEALEDALGEVDDDNTCITTTSTTTGLHTSTTTTTHNPIG